MQMPFTSEQFFQVMRQYNESVWPGQLVLYAIGVITTAVAIRMPARSKLVFATIALLWAWMAIAYHLAYFTTINPMAYLFGAMFLVQGALITWYAFRSRLQLSYDVGSARRGVGWALVAYALLAYPVLGYMLGQRYPTIPTFGLPCPTTIFTLGILVWCARPVPWTLFVVPALWSLIATSAAMTFGVGEDYALVPAFALAVGVFAWKPRMPAYRTA